MPRGRRLAPGQGVGGPKADSSTTFRDYFRTCGKRLELMIIAHGAVSVAESRGTRRKNCVMNWGLESIRAIGQDHETYTVEGP